MVEDLPWDRLLAYHEQALSIIQARNEFQAQIHGVKLRRKR